MAALDEKAQQLRPMVSTVLNSLKQVLTLLVDMTIQKHKVAPAVHKAVSEEIPQTLKNSCTEQDSQLRLLFLEALKPFMKNVPDPELAIHIITVTAHALIHNITVERPQLLDSKDIVNELVALYHHYLERPPA